MFDLFGRKAASENRELRNALRTLSIRDLAGAAMGISHGGERDIFDIYGYPRRPDFAYLYSYATHNDVGSTVTFKIPKSCWRTGFELRNEDEGGGDLILEDEVNKLIERGLTTVAERADALQRIGKFSILFVGVPDGLDPKEPVGRVLGNALESIYFRAFAFDGIEIYRRDNDPQSERFGLPELYQLQVISRGDNEKDVTTQPIIAHWSRCVHMAETKLDSDIEGIPIMQEVINRILDIDKATGGSSEAYFRNARGKTVFEIDKDFAADLVNNDEAKEKFDTAAKKFTNNQQDQIVSVGAQAKSLSTPHQSPRDTVMVAYWGVSGKTGIPIRILTGEGSGQLAGSEDKLAYNGIVADRQLFFCTPVTKGVLEILDMSGVISLPDEYYIWWPRQRATTETEEADIGLKRAQTLQSVVTALGSIGGDNVDAQSAMDAVNLSDIDVDDFVFDEPIDPAMRDAPTAPDEDESEEMEGDGEPDQNEPD